MERLATQAIRTRLLHRQPRRREDQKSLQRTQHGPHTTRKGTNGHVTLYIMYITEISLGSSQFRIRVSIKLHLQCHLSISRSHCTALPIPLQWLLSLTGLDQTYGHRRHSRSLCPSHKGTGLCGTMLASLKHCWVAWIRMMKGLC